MNKKIGPILLSGLMIGPVLGSGIVLLPPLAYNKLHGAAIWAWLIIMFLGALFAMIFCKLSVLYPGDGGMTIAIEKTLGKKFKLYSSFLLLSAVSFGPCAVFLTASSYLGHIQSFSMVPKPQIATILVLVSFVLLLKDLKFVSTLSFIISTVIALILIICSISVLVLHQPSIAPIQSVEIIPFGKTLMLLFWAIIGWEIVGNYSNQVKDLKKTIPLATIISLVVITLTYLIISIAIQSFAYSDGLSMVQILDPIFKSNASTILALLVTGLCLCCYLLIICSCSRLLLSLSTEGYLPKVFQTKNKNGIPYVALSYFTLMHITVLILTYFNLLNIESIVAIANGFFLGNALVGLIASLRIIDGLIYKFGGIILSISLLVLLLFSSYKILICLGLIFLISVFISNKIQNYSGDTLCIINSELEN